MKGDVLSDCMYSGTDRANARGYRRYLPERGDCGIWSLQPSRRQIGHDRRSEAIDNCLDVEPATEGHSAADDDPPMHMTGFVRI